MLRADADSLYRKRPRSTFFSDERVTPYRLKELTPAISQFEWSLQDTDPSTTKDPRKRYAGKSLRDFFLTQHSLAPDDLKAVSRTR